MLSALKEGGGAVNREKVIRIEIKSFREQVCFHTSALKVESGRSTPLPHLGLEPESVSRLAFQCDALSAELSLEL